MSEDSPCDDEHESDSSDNRRWERHKSKDYEPRCYTREDPISWRPELPHVPTSGCIIETWWTCRKESRKMAKNTPGANEDEHFVVFDPISTMCFLSTSIPACQTNSIQESPTIWLLHMLLKKQAAASLNSHNSLGFRSNRRWKERAQTIYCQVVKYLLERLPQTVLCPKWTPRSPALNSHRQQRQQSMPKLFSTSHCSSNRVYDEMYLSEYLSRGFMDKFNTACSHIGAQGKCYGPWLFMHMTCLTSFQELSHLLNMSHITNKPKNGRENRNDRRSNWTFTGVTQVNADSTTTSLAQSSSSTPPMPLMEPQFPNSNSKKPSVFSIMELADNSAYCCIFLSTTYFYCTAIWYWNSSECSS